MKKRLTVAVVVLLAALCIAAIPTYRFILQVQNGGTNIFTATSFARLNCSIGQCTASGSTITMNGGRQACDINIGDASGSVLTDLQLGPQVGMCYVPYGSTILELDVRADGGTPQVIVGRSRAGSVSNIVSSALATASSGAIACSKLTATLALNGVTTCSATLQNTTLQTGDFLELVSGTAGGVAKLMTIHVIYQ